MRFALRHVVSPGDNMGARDGAAFLRLRDPGELHEIGNRVLISAARVPIREVGEPFRLGQHVAEPVQPVVPHSAQSFVRREKRRLAVASGGDARRAAHIMCCAAPTRQINYGMIQKSKQPTKDPTMFMNRITSPAELTMDQLNDVNGGLNALTVVAAIGLTLAIDVAKAGVLVAVGVVEVAGALK